MRVHLVFSIVLVVGAACAADGVDSGTVDSDAAETADAVEAATSCVVIHEKDDQEEKNITCFENVALERTSFESGVCQWQTDDQASAQFETRTKFVAKCPALYNAYCDRLVLGPNVTAPVKIFLYDKSPDVLARAQKQCQSGGGNWHVHEKGAT